MLDSNHIINCYVVKFLCNLSFSFNGMKGVTFIFVIEMCPVEATNGFSIFQVITNI